MSMRASATSVYVTSRQGTPLWGTYVSALSRENERFVNKYFWIWTSPGPCVELLEADRYPGGHCKESIPRQLLPTVVGISLHPNVFLARVSVT